jgi:SNF2 family DNA or RNA helicase
MLYPPTKSKPWQHQIDAWNYAKNFKAYYYAHDMGAGKSKAAVDYCNGFESQFVLIICPKKVINVWPKQFNLHSKSTYRILALKKGTAESKARDIMQFLKDCERVKQPGVVITNYDIFWRPPLGPSYDGNKIVNKGILAQIPWSLIIADEAHRIKSPNGRASWGLARIAPAAERRLFLSGTPMPHSPLDVYAQFRALDPTIFGKSFALFRRRYCTMGGFQNKQILGFINQDDLQRRFYSRAHRVELRDVVDLPEETDITIECDLSPKTMKIYKELEEEFIAEVEGGTISVSNALEKMLRLSQITAGILPYIESETDESKVQIIDSSKLDTVVEIIQDLPLREPVVVFYRFKPEVRLLKERLIEIDRRPGEISGTIDEQEKFEKGEIDVVCVQIQAGSEGLDCLKRAHYCIYQTLTHSLGQYKQSRRRVMRPGQTEHCFYYHIIAKKTIDRKIVKALEKKEEVVNYVLRKIKKEKIQEAA